ncbi:MAG: aminopeptidase [Gammaproteobacteria bacterium]|nr:aminopeptidase [Gammaproteobacteria bacterium]NIM72771.1 aminopeptidase [Gammaproteobacteria bacterium]NIN38228.1 aminopeptidase [Gammaproteobacteria bacterium]NIO24519.1 aminopeptidase [Gammaproteobacteria bacterium]NIO65128.1 aminopeptidase [Gammaproteobacteria bacterium]
MALAALVAGTLALLGGCTTAGYYAQSIGGHLDLMSKRKDIGSLVEDASTPPELKSKLERAKAIREYATEELALPDNGSYRSYVDVGKPYVTWNVVATPALSLTAKTWCFVVVGCVAYRGYFDESEARRYGEQLAAEGMDVAIAGARAYSTLGWFDDPILNTILFDSEYRFAGTLFHELAHQRLFVTGDTAFNESYAVAVEREGVRRWLARNGTPAMLEAYAVEHERQEGFLTLVLSTRDKLEALYASQMDDAMKVREKERLFGALRDGYAQLKASWGGYAGYDEWFANGLNNAKLALLTAYNVHVPAFERLLAEQHGDMGKFHQAAEALSRLSREERDAALARLAAEAS